MTCKMPGSSGTPVVVPINGYSDGDSGKWPPGAPYVVNNSDIYLVKVATLWMDTRNEANKGTWSPGKPESFLALQLSLSFRQSVDLCVYSTLHWLPTLSVKIATPVKTLA